MRNCPFFIFASVIVGFAMAVMKHHYQSNVESKGFILLTVPNNNTSSKAVREGTQARQKPGSSS